MWENYFREDDAIPEWLESAQAELARIEGYFTLNPGESQAHIAADLRCRLVHNADTLRSRIVAIKAELTPKQIERVDKVKTWAEEGHASASVRHVFAGANPNESE